MKFIDASPESINDVMQNALNIFPFYRNIAPALKATLLEKIAANIEAIGDDLIFKASEETNLSTSRLLSERNRTTAQLRRFAEMLREGSWVEATIDSADPQRKPTAKPDLRKLLIPLGPVVVFGASNFPFAYSTAGGDTASALAAGCPVVVKAHQAHATTSKMVADAISEALSYCKLPLAIFQHVNGAGFKTGKMLVQHPATAAVGFTGSFTGGKALYDYAHERKNPIPVFSEMGSVNPVIFFPGILAENSINLAKSFAASITNGMGQFCTKPGLLFALQNDNCESFYHLLQQFIKEAAPARMLHDGIFTSYKKNTKKALTAAGLDIERSAELEDRAMPAVAAVTGEVFLKNPVLHEEVFGPFSILVKCRDMDELKFAWNAVSGQLTTTMIGTEKDFQDNALLIEAATQTAGRIVFNGVPTGVEVCAGMVHGGPYPATTDSRFTAVGVNAVKRWVRPVCFQNCPDALLPIALKKANPSEIFRQLNNIWTKDAG